MLAFAVEASAEGAAVTLSARADSGAWHATVTYVSNETALNDPALPHLLEAFARKQAGEPREAKRIAWVFALCKRVAEAHGGNFEQSDSSGGEPVTLSLRVPLSAVGPK